MEKPLDLFSASMTTQAVWSSMETGNNTEVWEDWREYGFGMCVSSGEPWLHLLMEYWSHYLNICILLCKIVVTTPWDCSEGS